MKYLDKIFFYLMVAAFSVFTACDGVGKASREKTTFDRSAVPELNAGDIVLRKGKGLKSDAVTIVDRHGIYSHAGIIVDYGGKIMVVHSVPSSTPGKETPVVMEPLEDFFADKEAVCGMILSSGWPRELKAKAAGRALDFYTNEIKFDYAYDLSDTTTAYCTELVWRSYLHAGEDITQGRRTEVDEIPGYDGSFILPSDIINNNELIPIYQF